MQTSNMTLEQQIAALKAENEALKAKNVKVTTISMKVSDKGAVSIYGLGRFPVTLYGEQWDRLLDKADAIRAFMNEHRASLKTKGDKDDKETKAA